MEERVRHGILNGKDIFSYKDGRINLIGACSRYLIIHSSSLTTKMLLETMSHAQEPRRESTIRDCSVPCQRGVTVWHYPNHLSLQISLCHPAQYSRSSSVSY